MKKSLNRKHTDILLYSSLKAAYLFVNRHKEEFGLMWNEVLLLKHLQSRGMIRISDAAKFLEIPVFKASRLISKLEKAGFAERSEHAPPALSVQSAPPAPSVQSAQSAPSNLSAQSAQSKDRGKKDKRAVGIRLTEKGTARIEEIDEYNYQKIMEHITEFSAREIKGMMRAAEKLDLLLGVRREE